MTMSCPLMQLKSDKQASESDWGPCLDESFMARFYAAHSDDHG